MLLFNADNFSGIFHWFVPNKNNLYCLVLNLKNKKRGNKNEKTLSFCKKHMSITSSTNVVFELMNFFNFRSSTDWFVALRLASHYQLDAIWISETSLWNYECKPHHTIHLFFCHKFPLMVKSIYTYSMVDWFCKLNWWFDPLSPIEVSFSQPYET